MKINKLIKNNRSLLRYVLVSAQSYIFILLFIYIFVDYFNVNKRISYLFIYGLNFLIVFFLNSKFVFKSKADYKTVLRYIFFLFFVYCMSYSLFELFLFVNLDYLIATFLSMAIGFPIKFFVSKKIVFKP